jgi:single-strand DNA-binding protein
MADLNKVLLIGNLTRDPEVRHTPQGTAIADLRLAANRRYRTQGGEDKEETCFVDVDVWGRQAELCGQYLVKGRRVLIEGRLRYSEWEKDGQKRSKLSVTAERVQFMDGRKSGGEEVGDAPAEREAPRSAGAPERAQPDDDIPF